MTITIEDVQRLRERASAVSGEDATGWSANRCLNAIARARMQQAIGNARIASMKDRTPLNPIDPVKIKRMVQSIARRVA